MSRIDWKLEDRVAVVTMGEDDNKLNIPMVRSLLEMLDAIENETGALALVVKSGHSHIWTNGFDSDWIQASLERGDAAAVREFLVADLALRRRMLTYPMITIAALNGHTFGGGAVFSCCFDFRFMRSDRGYFCIPVIDRGFPILPSTRLLLENVMPVYIMEELVLTGRRLTGTECAAGHIVSAVYSNDELMDKVMAFACGLNKGRGIVGAMKKVRNGPIVKLMKEDAEGLQEGKVEV